MTRERRRQPKRENVSRTHENRREWFIKSQTEDRSDFFLKLKNKRQEE